MRKESRRSNRRRMIAGLHRITTKDKTISPEEIKLLTNRIENRIKTDKETENKNKKEKEEKIKTNTLEENMRDCEDLFEIDYPLMYQDQYLAPFDY